MEFEVKYQRTAQGSTLSHSFWLQPVSVREPLRRRKRVWHTLTLPISSSLQAGHLPAPPHIGPGSEQSASEAGGPLEADPSLVVLHHCPAPHALPVASLDSHSPEGFKAQGGEHLTCSPGPVAAIGKVE